MARLSPGTHPPGQASRPERPRCDAARAAQRVGAKVQLHADHPQTGRLFKAATVLESATDFRTRQTGPAVARTFAWSAACTCIEYTGARFAL